MDSLRINFRSFLLFSWRYKQQNLKYSEFPVDWGLTGMLFYASGMCISLWLLIASPIGGGSTSKRVDVFIKAAHLYSFKSCCGHFHVCWTNTSAGTDMGQQLHWSSIWLAQRTPASWNFLHGPRQKGLSSMHYFNLLWQQSCTIRVLPNWFPFLTTQGFTLQGHSLEEPKQANSDGIKRALVPFLAGWWTYELKAAGPTRLLRSV